jgi:hypothetical protein
MKRKITVTSSQCGFKSNYILLLVILLLPFAFTTSCSEEESSGPINPCDTVDVTYSGVIQPLLAANCYSCHGNGQSRAGVTLDTYEGVYTVAISGQLSGAVNHESGYTAMPYQRQKLDSCSIYFIDTWIEAGAPEN